MPSDRPVTSDPWDFHNVYDQTLIFVVDKDAAAGTVKLKLLAEHAPELESFRVDAGDRSFDKPLPGDVILGLRPGLNRFSARVKTTFGWLGPQSRVSILYKPAWSFRIL